ncbi:flagellar assembly protein [Mariprofundus erugo]|uniref:Flagellar assembly protein FliH n=1 Tax=Mariprofundus erugo TaxID=2528639 RepID=A0A5R9GXU9_9PROT|nr:FliH/SctL family protein [Mariprofundus erugo]TLS68953.1 flagellar assembly protein [Mariprofundus erugo]TLS75247.1 flagellar assembly protein [Mariprofundus erugo]
MNPLTFPPGNGESPTAPAKPFPFSPPGPTSPSPAAAAGASENRMQQLERMLHEMQGRAETVEKEAYDKAYLAGEKAGMALGKKRGEQILEALENSLKDVEYDIAAIRNVFAEAALEVAGHIAEHIVGQTITTDKARLLEITRKAAAQLPDTTDLRIAVAPDDYTLFKRMLDDDGATMVLSAEPSVNPGTCRLISANQDMLIDPVAAVSSCLAQLQPALLESVMIPVPINTAAPADTVDEATD